jgi:hypothetical protein
MPAATHHLQVYRTRGKDGLLLWLNPASAMIRNNPNNMTMYLPVIMGWIPVYDVV